MEPEIKNYSNNNSHLVFYISILLLLFIGGGLYLLFLKNKISDQPKTSITNDRVFSMEYQLSNLHNRAEIIVPPISSEEDVDTTSLLPVAVIDLFDQQKVFTKIKSVTYDNKLSGFTFEFVIQKNLRDVYFSLWTNFERKGWTVSYGSRYDDAGLFNISNTNYSLSVELTKLTDTETLIKVVTMNKI